MNLGVEAKKRNEIPQILGSSKSAVEETKLKQVIIVRSDGNRNDF